MYCHKCGAKNGDGVRFCIKCGQSLQSTGQIPVGNTGFANNPYRRKPHERKPSGGWKWAAAIVGVLIVVIVVCVITLSGKDNEGTLPVAAGTESPAAENEDTPVPMATKDGAAFTGFPDAPGPNMLWIEDITGYSTSVVCNGHHLFISPQQDIYLYEYTDTSVSIMKYDKDGSKKDSFTVMSSSNDFPLDMAINSDNDIYIVFTNLLLKKYDAAGRMLWEPNTTVPFYTVCIDGNNDVIAAGSQWESQLCMPTHIFKFDAVGRLKWEKTSGFDDGYRLIVKDICVDGEGNIYLTGYEGWTISDLKIIKLDPNGEVLWEKRIGTEELHDEGWLIGTDSENNVIVYGFIDKPWVGYADKLWLGKFSPDGEEIFTATCYEGYKHGTPSGLAIGSDNNIYICGYGYNNGTEEWFVSKYDARGNLEWTFNDGHLPEIEGIVIDENDDIYLIDNSILGKMDTE